MMLARSLGLFEGYCTTLSLILGKKGGEIVKEEKIVLGMLSIFSITFDRNPYRMIGKLGSFVNMLERIHYEYQRYSFSFVPFFLWWNLIWIFFLVPPVCWLCVQIFHIFCLQCWFPQFFWELLTLLI